MHKDKEDHKQIEWDESISVLEFNIAITEAVTYADTEDFDA